ncbi:MAG: large subunit ribosomal protein [Blastocatellia bacterium]|jgi:large subunit ribosomal protein L18|nr:large subunit ribosomal protein [Blastocatellia bacterium]
MPIRNRAIVRKAIHSRIRRKVRGSTARPRLAIYRSTNHIYAQIIDDERGQTVASASSTEKDLRGSTGGNIEAAKRIGRTIAERAQAAGVKQVVFDRGGYLYHGRIKALTDAAREAGLNPEETRAAEAEAAAAAAEAEATPLKGEGKPAKGEGKPAKGEGKPAKGEGKPAKDEAKAAKGEDKAAKKKTPAAGEEKPVKAAAPAAADEAKPAEDAATPAPTEATPAAANEAGAEEE